MIIYRPTDKIELQIGEVTMVISPLSRAQRVKLLSIMDESGKEGVSKKANLELTHETIRMSVKSISAPGYKTSDDKEIELQLNDLNELTEDSLELVLAILSTQQLALIAGTLLTETVKKWSIPGVEVKGLIKSASSSQEKKA